MTFIITNKNGSRTQYSNHYDEDDEKIECTECDGTGYVECKKCRGDGEIDCPECY